MMMSTQRKLSRAAVLTLLAFILGLLSYMPALALGWEGEPQPAKPDETAAGMPLAGEALTPAYTCPDVVGQPGTVRCHLFARPGTKTMPDGTVVPFYGFAPGFYMQPELPGPTLVVEQGRTIEFLVYNYLGINPLDPNGNLSLSIPGLDLPPDTVGIPDGWQKQYFVVASKPGTYIYQAGPTDNFVRQVPMGLFGLLIVKPAVPNQAYEDAGTAYTKDATLVFSEFDTGLNAHPLAYEMAEYSPEYRLLNGEVYNQGAIIPVVPGDILLLRMVNAGIEERSIGILGLNQTQIATNGDRLPFDYSFFARPMGAGATMDVLVQIPASVPVGTRYPVINTAMQQLHDNGALAPDGTVAFGGAIAFIEVMGNVPVADTGPLVSNVTASPDPASGASTVTLSATLDETSTGGEQIVAAEWFTKTTTLPGQGVQFTVTPGVTINVAATIPPTTLAVWPAGDVTLYVRGQDADGTWGPLGSTVLDLVKSGPVIRSLSVNPAVTNGSKEVSFRGTADDTATGNVNVVSVEYFLDATGVDGTGLPVTQNMTAPIVGLSGSVSMTTLSSLAEGTHTIYIHGLDELGNWGAYTPIDFTVDRTGPGAVGLSVTPNPNNGRQQLNSSMYVVRARASLLDSTNITGAEGFFDTPGTVGTGFAWIPADGLFNSNNEVIYVDIPLTTVIQFADGPHTIYVHGQDQAGNWGDFATLELVIDKGGPAISGQNVTPNPTGGAASVTLSGTATDPVNDTAPGSNVVAAEWFEGFDPGLGMGTPMGALDGAFDSASETLTAEINVSGWTNGDHIISLRAKDAAGNWGALVQVTLSVSNNLNNHILLDDFESGNLMSAWNYATTDVYNSYSAALEGTQGLRIMLRNGSPTYLVDRTPSSENAYRASFLIDASNLDTLGTALGFLSGESAGAEALFGLEFMRGANGGELRAWALSGGQRIYGGWSGLADGVQRVELTWESGSSATLYLMVNGAPVSAIRGVDTSAYRLETVKLGPAEAYSTSLFGSLFFDSFESYRLLPAAPQFKVFMPSVVSGAGQ